MNPYYLSTWAMILRAAVVEGTGPIATFSNPAQAIQQMYRQQAEGTNSWVVTNDGELYWLVSESLATRLCTHNFYPVLEANS